MSDELSSDDDKTVDPVLLEINWKIFRAEELDEAFDLWEANPHEGSWKFLMDAFQNFVMSVSWTDP